ncbi:MAG: hypothetical protein ACRDE8_08560 [Ginsengibacter sp.]
MSYRTYFFLKGVFYFMDLLSSTTFIVLCGKTGSGKTLVLQQLESSGYPCINLERIASHRGSTFGNLLLPSQPSQEDFENELQNICSHFASSKYIFIEMKSSSIGKRKIPRWFYSKMKNGILAELNTDKKTRVNNILNEYKSAGKEKLINALHKLNERLPADESKELQEYLEQENYQMFIERILEYYDATANYQMSKKPIISLPVNSFDMVQITNQILQALKFQNIIIS